VLRLKTNPKAPDVAIAGSGVVVLGAGGDFAAIGNPDKGDAKPYSCRAADGTPLRDCVPEEGTAHQINSLVFGLDGALYVASGDGINYGEGSLRAQELDNLSGKILRINPLTGDGYANNPFFDGDLKSNRSKIFAYGMRNPFRLAVQPRTGAIYSAEVGNNQFEEVNLVVRGANLGWPCFEGAKANAFDPICQPLLDGQTAVTHALYAYPHENGRGAVIGGAFYTNKLYPADYAGLYFFADFNVGVIHTLAVEKSGAVTMKDFASGAWGIVQISLGPDGVLYWLSVQTGSLYRIVYEKK
jgi:glucose/arabinose dehydrogenase